MTVWTASAMGQKGGAIGGRSRSPAKQAAARANGRKGGRPKKALDTCQDPCIIKAAMGRHALYRPIYDLKPAFVRLAHLAPDDLVRALGCSRSYLYRLQTGTRQPSRAMASRLAAIAQLDVADLTVRVETPTDSEETAQDASERRNHARA